jgi:hypothetical protein
MENEMSTSIAIATAANTTALIAQQQAAEGAKMACQAWMPNYTHANATVEKMQAYAECVNRVYPQPMSPDSMIALKVAVALLFVGVIVGTWRGMNDYDGPVLGAIGGFLFVICAEFALFLVGAGLMFLFS